MNEDTPLSAEDEGRLDDFYRTMEKESRKFPYNGSGISRLVQGSSPSHH